MHHSDLVALLFTAVLLLLLGGKEVAGLVYLGPIIGYTDSTTTRVLVEIAANQSLTVTLTSGTSVFTRTQNVNASEPYIFSFTGWLLASYGG
eukprot:NODE_6709_length_543_cov_21.742915_g6287_i0.p1 GENE.NODE_6709_length_543_cov_21.742915_g6287_i0~~NODE_6709_length_543_cov_21.742915_g6287_i0.p1  ORF type:complete len:108 (+),score=33.05 NODE_6709_length_543_cov_21.742915_g6287_i0:51-326(+)